MERTRLVFTCAGLFVLTASILMLQLLEMRLLSFMLWHHLAYMVISVVLLGLGAGGAAASVFASQLRRCSGAPAICASLCGASTIVALALLVRIELDTFDLGKQQLLTLSLYYAALVVPYFFAGLSLALLFTQGIARINLFYCIDLIGSAAGCGVFYVIIEPLGAPVAIAASALLAGVSGILLAAGSGSRKAMLTSLAISIGLGASVLAAESILRARPAASKSLAQHLKARGARIVSTRWTPISRVDVLEADVSTNTFLLTPVLAADMKMITADGDANTWMFRTPDVRASLPKPSNDQYTSYYAAFLLQREPDVLIIGPGGGNEVFAALVMGARRVVAAELNPAIRDVCLRQYPEFAGFLYQSPKVESLLAEGRSFVRSRGERFDIIQMSGVDTWAGLSSGAYVLAENFLYTEDAIVDFYRHLKPGGILSIQRFRLDPPRETLRLVSVALSALRKLGVEKPENHVVVVSFGDPKMARLLVKETPFTSAEVNLLQDETLRAGNGGVIHYAPGLIRNNAYWRLAKAFAEGDEAAFFVDYPYDVTPVSDDRPFFFEYYKWGNIFRDLTNPGVGGQVGANRPVGLVILFSLLAQVTLLVAAFILLPLWVFKRRGIMIPGRSPVVIYFSCLGLGFMFVEIGLMQRFVLFLSHPAYSIPVVLGTLLVSSGIGSFAAGRLPLDRRGRFTVSLVGVVVVLAVLLVALGPLFDRCLGLPFVWRIAVAVAALAPLGFMLGMPFPLGLLTVSGNAAEAVPWAWGINGGTSVLGSVLAVVVAMRMGFNTVLVVAALLYVTAFWAGRRICRSTAC